MTDKPIVVGGSVSIKDILTSPKPFWVERRLPSDNEAVDAKTFTGGIRDIKQAITPATRIPMIIRPRTAVEDRIDHRRGFLQHTGRSGYSEAMKFHGLVGGAPYARSYSNMMAPLTMEEMFGVNASRVSASIGYIYYGIAGHNLLGFDHRPKRVVSGIKVSGNQLIVGGYFIPNLNFYFETRSGRRSLWTTEAEMDEALRKLGATEMYPDYGYYHQVEKLRFDGQRKFYFPMGMPDGGLRRGELSIMTSDCRTGSKPK